MARHLEPSPERCCVRFSRPPDRRKIGAGCGSPRCRELAMETATAAVVVEETTEDVDLYWWMFPAWLAGSVRPGLRAATVADAARLSQLPTWIAVVALPLLAIAVPVAISI